MEFVSALLMLSIGTLAQPDRRANKAFSFTATRAVESNKSSRERP
jgi:hypothetical protein